MYGCSGRCGDLVAVAPLDDLAVVHHRDPVPQVADDGEVVGDEQVRHAGALLDLPEQVQHPRLGRQVQRRDRLVADDQPGVEGERAGDGDPLPLAAGELPRQPVGRRRSAGRPDRAGSRTRVAGLPCIGTFRTVSGSVRICSIVSDGFSEVYGSWNTTWISLDSAAALLAAEVRDVATLVEDLRRR